MQGPALLHAYRSRNEIMKQWVAERPAGSNILFVDFDAMSLAANAPPICAKENWHYQVSLLAGLECKVNVVLVHSLTSLLVEA